MAGVFPGHAKTIVVTIFKTYIATHHAVGLPPQPVTPG